MALWGNNDNLVSSGTVSLNYSNKTVTGTGTTFGTTGFGEVGDVIRFGSRGSGGTYFGEAVIVSVANTQSCTIDHTDGLSGATISGAEYYLSELPKSTAKDHIWSGKHRGAPTFKNHLTRSAVDASAVAELNIAINLQGDPNQPGIRHPYIDLAVGDHYLDSPNADTGTGIEVIGVGTANATNTSLAIVGSDRVFVVAPPGVVVGDEITVTTGGVSGATVASIASTYVTLAGTATTLSVAVAKDARVQFKSDNVVSLASTISSGISTSDVLYFQRRSGGYDKLIYGISDTTSALYDGDSGSYRTEGGGWVGVTTYVDMHGNLRVKSETIVAMSGISTGIHGIGYPTPV